MRLGNTELTCSLLKANSEVDCLNLEWISQAFFSEESVLERISNPSTYFQQISNIAFKEVYKC